MQWVLATLIVKALAVLHANAQLSECHRETRRDTHRDNHPSRTIRKDAVDAVSQENRSQAHGEMTDHKQDRQRVMRNETDVPRIEQQAARRAGGPFESGVYSQEPPSQDEDRNQV